MAESDDNLLLFNQNAWQRVSRQILNTLCGLFVGRMGSLDLEGGWFVVIVCLGMNRSSWESWLKIHWGERGFPGHPRKPPIYHWEHSKECVYHANMES